MAKNTKISLYDLNDSLKKLIEELISFQGTHPTLLEKFTSLTPDVFDEETETVLNDLILSYQDSGILTIQKIENMRDEIKIATAQLERAVNDAGNYNESFAYDVDGNVKTHTVTGDQAYTVDYTYKTDGSGELASSVKSYVDSAGRQVKATKTYIYTNGSITGIQTSTVVDTIAPKEVTSLTATTPNVQSVTLTWVNPTDTDFAFVNIYKDGGTTPVAENVTGTSRVISGLITGQSHIFKVRTVDTSGNESAGVTTTSVLVR